jgi:subtilisin family serine protease
VLAIAPLIIAATQAAAAHASIDARIFEGKPEGARASFLVVLNDAADVSSAPSIADRLERRRFVYESLRSQAAASQAALTKRLEEAGVRFRTHWLADTVEVEGDARLARELSARSEVSRIVANAAAPLRRPQGLPPRAAPRDAGAVADTNITKIGAPALWNTGITGAGIVVGVADTGFEWTHPALAARYRGMLGDPSYAWHDAVHDAMPTNRCGSDAPQPCDDEGHGTGTAALAVGESGIGTAPGATLIGCRNMDQGNGTPARYIECFEWLLAPTDSSGNNPRLDLGADVINNSWTCPASEGCTDPEILKGVVEAVRAAGVAVVFAAGNDGNVGAGGPACSTVDEAPAIYAAALSVGATSVDDTLAVFSSVGPVAADGSSRIKPDLMAPGISLRTASPGGSYTYSFSGTSGAAPQVSGAIALLWSAAPELQGNVDLTEQLLEEGAVPLRMAATCSGFSGEDVPNPYFGWGRLDVAGAYALIAPAREELVRLPILPPAPRSLRPRP